MKVIQSKKEYKLALKRFEEIFAAKPKTKEGDEAELLSLLIKDYENRNVKIEYPDPIEAIKFHIEQQTQSIEEAVPLFGGKKRLLEILNREQPLDLELVYKLHKHFDIPLTSLINDKLNYKLKNGKMAISS